MRRMQRSRNVKENAELNRNAGNREMVRAIVLEEMSDGDLTSRVNLSEPLVATLYPDKLIGGQYEGASTSGLDGHYQD